MNNPLDPTSNTPERANLPRFFGRTSLHIILIVVFGLIAYSNTFHVPFVFDDESSIIKNPIIRNLDNFLSGGGYAYNPRRFVGYLTIALNYRLGGLDVTGYHILNLAVHIASALLVYALVRLTFRTPFFGNAECGMRSAEFTSLHIPNSEFRIPNSLVPLLAALLFVSHPVQTQAVTYIIQRVASLATMFYLAALVLYVRARLFQEEERPARGKAAACYLSALLSAGLAMKTKEIAFTLPLITVLFEFSFFRTTIRKKLLFLLPLLLTLIIIPLSMLHADKPLGELLSDVSERTRVQTEISRGDYLLTQVSVIATYIRLLFLPINQNLDYDYPVFHSLLTPRVLLSFVFLLALLGVAVWLYYSSYQFKMQSAKCKVQNGDQKNDFAICNLQFAICTPGAQRLAAFGIFWFFITLSVESSVIPIVDVIFEHRLYLPSAGAFIAAAAACALALRRLPAKAYLISSVAIAIVFTAATWKRNVAWNDTVTLWKDVVRKSPGKARPHDLLGYELLRRGSTEQAIEQFSIALNINPYFAYAHNNLGVAYDKKGWVDKAIAQFQLAQIYDYQYAEAHFNLGTVYMNRGWLDKAIEQYQVALKLKPDFVAVHNNLGVVYATIGSMDKAIAHFQAAANLDPDDADARNNLAKAMNSLRR